MIEEAWRLAGCVWTLASQDLRIWSRSRTAIAAALIPPLAMVLLLYVLTLTVGRQPVALVIQSEGRYAGRMAAIFRSEADAYLLTETDMSSAQRLLGDQRVVAIVVIPPAFDAAVPLHTATVRVILNNIDRDFADDVRRTVARSVGRFDAPDIVTPANEGELDASERNPYRVNVTTFEQRRTTVDYLHYSVVPALILLALSVGVMGTAMLCAQDVERGTSRYLVLAPVPAWALVAGRLLGGFLAVVVVMVPCLLIATLTGVVAPPAGHWPALAALFAATALCAAGIGAVLGSVLTGTRTVAMTASVVSTYLFFLGGGFTTIQFLPEWLRRLAALAPTSFAIDGLRQALFYPDLAGLGLDLAVLFATAGATLAAGAFFVRRSWSR